MRHPSSQQPDPPKDGKYWIQSCLGDVWRKVNWCDGDFRLGLRREVWFAWKPIGDMECEKK